MPLKECASSPRRRAPSPRRAPSRFVLATLLARACAYEEIVLDDATCLGPVRVLLPSEPTSLVISLHGSSDDGDDQADYILTGVNEDTGGIYGRSDASALLDARG